MTRTLTAEMQTEFQAASSRPFLLAELEFFGTTLRLSTRPNDMEWDKVIWLGNGWLKPLRAVDESPSLRATGIEVELSGIDPITVGLILNSARQSMTGRVYLGCLDENWDVIDDPLLVFQGKLDVPEIQNTSETTVAVLRYESDLIVLERPNEFRYTHEAQQGLFPGDFGFEYATLMEDWSGFWGKAERPRRTVKRKGRK